MSDFSTMGLNEPIISAITELGFKNPTEVQLKSIPLLIDKPKDIISLAQTGTGKTAAFGLPILHHIDTNSKSTQSLIISPTRELCLQITTELKKYAVNLNRINIVAIYGGSNIQEQAKSIKRGAQIIVATPGRMLDMLRRKYVNISKIDFCVLDEADEMLNMGFYNDIKSILAKTPKTKKTWLFSATMPKEVSIIAEEFMKNPYKITVGEKNSSSINVSHISFLTNTRNKYNSLKLFIDSCSDIYSIIFCRTRRETQKICENLIEDGYSSGALHGDLSQNQRDSVMKSFRVKQIKILVATDVASRGIDVENITHIIHYKIPDEAEIYNHRSGRTGRASKKGLSVLFFSESEKRKLKFIENKLKIKIKSTQLPSKNEVFTNQIKEYFEKIINTTFNEDLSPFLSLINENLDSISKEELIKKIASLEFERKLNLFKEEEVKTSKGKKDKDLRYQINLGTKDYYNWQNLKDFLTELCSLSPGDIYNVDVQKTKSFFNSKPEHKELIFKVFNNFEIENRTINVNITNRRGQKDESSRYHKERRFSKGNKRKKPKRSRRNF
jgi:ATP-dependent RNA helicase DeaD